MIVGCYRRWSDVGDCDDQLPWVGDNVTFVGDVSWPNTDDWETGR
jgi:hypothetical protein